MTRYVQRSYGTCADKLVDQEIHRRSGNELPYVPTIFVLICANVIVVKFGFNSLTTLEDLERVKAFFKDKGMSALDVVV